MDWILYDGGLRHERVKQFWKWFQRSTLKESFSNYGPRVKPLHAGPMNYYDFILPKLRIN